MLYKPETGNRDPRPLSGRERPEDTAQAIAAIRALFAEEGKPRVSRVTPQTHVVPQKVAPPAAAEPATPPETLKEPKLTMDEARAISAALGTLGDEPRTIPARSVERHKAKTRGGFSPDFRISAGIFAVALILFHPIALPVVILSILAVITAAYLLLGSEKINAAFLDRHATLQAKDPARAARMRRVGNRWAARLDRWCGYLPVHWTQNLYFPVFDAETPEDMAANDPFARLLPQDRL